MRMTGERSGVFARLIAVDPGSYNSIGEARFSEGSPGSSKRGDGVEIEHRRYERRRGRSQRSLRRICGVTGSDVDAVGATGLFEGEH